MDFRNAITTITVATVLFAVHQAQAQSDMPLAAPAGQSNPSPSNVPSFEIASIRPHQGPLRVIAGFDASGPRLRLEGYNLRLLVMEAYNLPHYRVSFAGSNAVQSEETNIYYDIIAKADENSAPDRAVFRQMLQSLLADRFNLRFHYETTEIPVDALIVGKKGGNGLKFKESAPDEKRHYLVGVHGRNQTITASKVSASTLANILDGSFGSGVPVIDKTGLAGDYDITFEATPECRINNNPQPEDISIFTALEEQLGLKLERQKMQIDVLTVDHMEKPSEN